MHGSTTGTDVSHCFTTAPVGMFSAVQTLPTAAQIADRSEPSSLRVSDLCKALNAPCATGPAQTHRPGDQASRHGTSGGSATDEGSLPSKTKTNKTLTSTFIMRRPCSLQAASPAAFGNGCRLGPDRPDQSGESEERSLYIEIYQLYTFFYRTLCVTYQGKSYLGRSWLAGWAEAS